MAWLYHPISFGDTIQQGAFYELWTAYGERSNVVGASGIPGLPAPWGLPGDDIQTQAVYREMQDYIEAACTNWVRPDVTYHRDGAPDDSSDWEWASLAEFRAAAGLHADGFTRKRWLEFSSLAATEYVYPGPAFLSTLTRPFADGDVALNADDGLVYRRDAGAWTLLGRCQGMNRPHVFTADYGKLREGDILGEWVFNELYECFRLMRWTLGTVTWDSETGRINGGGGASNASWNAAKTSAEANYDLEYPGSTAGNERVLMSTLGQFSGFQWTSNIDTTRRRVTVTHALAPYARQIEAYVRAMKAPAPSGSIRTFDANGTGLVEDDWTLTDTFGPNTTTSNQTGNHIPAAALADGSYPTWCDEPTTSTGTSRGMHVPNFGSGSGAIVKWDVAGGFTKP